MCAGLAFSLMFLSQSCSVFLSCDISTVIVLIRGSGELPCCCGVWQFVFFSAKEHVSDRLHALHHHLIPTRGSGAALAAVERVSEGSQGDEETAVLGVGGDQQQHSMGQIPRLLLLRT